jgi:hypothetical protein
VADSLAPGNSRSRTASYHASLGYQFPDERAMPAKKNRRAAQDVSRAFNPLPKFFTPMMAQRADQLPEGDEWSYESQTRWITLLLRRYLAAFGCGPAASDCRRPYAPSAHLERAVFRDFTQTTSRSPHLSSSLKRITIATIHSPFLCIDRFDQSAASPRALVRAYSSHRSHRSDMRTSFS